MGREGTSCAMDLDNVSYKEQSGVVGQVVDTQSSQTAHGGWQWNLCAATMPAVSQNHVALPADWSLEVARECRSGRFLLVRYVCAFGPSVLASTCCRDCSCTGQGTWYYNRRRHERFFLLWRRASCCVSVFGPKEKHTGQFYVYKRNTLSTRNRHTATSTLQDESHRHFRCCRRCRCIGSRGCSMGS